MAQVTDLLKTPNVDIAPSMSIDEASRRILYIVNQLPNFIVSSSLSAIYNSAPPTLSNGASSSLQTDVTGNLRVVEQFVPVAEDNTNGVISYASKPLATSTYCWSVAQTGALATSLVVKASTGTLRLVSGRIDATAPSATYYLQFYNASSLPADGAVSLLCAPTKIVHISGTDNVINLDFTMNCIYSSIGIVCGLSTTEFTKTVSGAYLSTTVLYK